MSVAIADAFRYVATSGTNAGEVDGTLTAPGVGGTLTIVGGFGITLTSDTANRKITITNTGNGTGALTTITAQNSAGTYYPVFTTAPGTFNPATGTYTSSTLYYESTTTPLSYNPGTGTLNVNNLVLGAAGTFSLDGITSTGVTGTGNVVFGTSPSLVTPTLGVATATSLNGLTITSSTGTFTLTNLKTFAVQNTITLAGTDSTTITLPGTTGTVPLNNQTFFIGSTSVAINRASASLALTGITSIDGYAAGITGGAVGYIPYQSAANTTLFVTGNTSTTPQFLTSTGTGSVAQAPTLTSSTGTGNVVLATSPSLTTPTLGVATATSVNKMAITAPATGSTLAVADGKTFSVSNTITLAGTDSTTITLPSTTGTVPLNNQTMFIGTTSVAINRATANLALTGISSVAFPGSTSGTVTVQATATAGTPTLSLPITTGTLIGTGDTGTVSNTMLANSSVTFGSTAVSLGGSSTTLAGLTSIDGTTGLTSAFATPNGTVALLGAATTLNLANAATTVAEFGAATTYSLANTATGAQTVNMFTASTGASTYNFATGATLSATTKAINIGTGGVSGSTTNITIGSSTGGGATTINNYTPNLSYVTANLSAVAFTSTTWVSLGSIVIPSSGIWRVWANLRIRASGAAEFIKCGLFSSGTSGTGELLNSGVAQERMLVERIAQTSGQSFFNLLCAPEWIVNMPTGQTYPYTIYIQVQSSAADAQGLNNTDANGIPTFNAVRIAPTATSGTTVNIN